tara:strand:+ start:451 stop:1155 length:705 start_codon:yes stop_codon:yes gene_type:complete
MSQTKWDQFNFDEIVIKEPVKNSKGGHNCYMDTSATNKSNPTFQMPRCKIPFGLDRNEQSTSTRYNLELSIQDPGFYDKMRAFDERVIEEGAKNSKAWFGKNYSATKIRDQEMYRHSCKGSLDGKYPPLMRIKVATEKQVPKIYILHTNSNGEQSWSKGTHADIQKGAFVTPIVSMSGVWFVQKQFGCAYLATHLLIEKSAEEDAFPFVGVTAEPHSEAMEVDNNNEDPYREIE